VAIGVGVMGGVATYCYFDPESCAGILEDAKKICEGSVNFLSKAIDSTEHTSNARPSTKRKHEKGQSRKIKDRSGEKGDLVRREKRKKPLNWKGPWPPE